MSAGDRIFSLLCLSGCLIVRTQTEAGWEEGWEEATWSVAQEQADAAAAELSLLVLLKNPSVIDSRFLNLVTPLSLFAAHFAQILVAVGRGVRLIIRTHDYEHFLGNVPTVCPGKVPRVFFAKRLRFLLLGS